MSWPRGEHGFTLIELLVTMTITTIVFGATLSVLDIFQENNRYALLRNEIQDNARNAADRLARQLRNTAAPSTGAAGALEVAKAYSIVLQTIDSSERTYGPGNPTHAMRVRYCLNDANAKNEVLWMQVQHEPAGKELPTATACPDTSGAWESSSQLVQHVTNRINAKNRALFVYSATSTAQINSVEMVLYLDANPGSRPGETELKSGVGLRNANRPPVATFTATPVNEHVRLNASQSEDPDGLALTYTWWKDGALQSTTAQQWETAETESKGTHVYKLRVTDPGELSSETERTVLIP